MARESGSLMPPMHILNAPTRLMRDLGHGRLENCCAPGGYGSTSK